MNEAISLIELCVILGEIALSLGVSDPPLDCKTFEFCISSQFKSVPCKGKKAKGEGKGYGRGWEAGGQEEEGEHVWELQCQFHDSSSLTFKGSSFPILTGQSLRPC